MKEWFIHCIEYHTCKKVVLESGFVTCVRKTRLSSGKTYFMAHLGFLKTSTCFLDLSVYKKKIQSIPLYDKMDLEWRVINMYNEHA